MRQVSIIGVGMYKFGEQPKLRIEDMGKVACENALKDSGISRREIEAVYCATFLEEVQAGQRVVYEIGMA